MGPIWLFYAPTVLHDSAFNPRRLLRVEVSWLLEMCPSRNSVDVFRI